MVCFFGTNDKDAGMIQAICEEPMCFERILNPICSASGALSGGMADTFEEMEYRIFHKNHSNPLDIEFTLHCMVGLYQIEGGFSNGSGKG